jgi:hypothetical protein
MVHKALFALAMLAAMCWAHCILESNILGGSDKEKSKTTMAKEKEPVCDSIHQKHTMEK